MTAIKVISLSTSNLRRTMFSEANPHLQYAFFDAIDGAGLNVDALVDPRLFAPGLPYTRGAYGCALSHLQLWQEAIARNENLTIAEDDAIFRLDFEAQCARCLRELASDWDVILRGWNFDSILSVKAMPEVSPSVMVFDQDQLRQNIEGFKNMTGKPHLLRLDKCFGIPAYSISPAGARKFIANCFPLTNFSLFFPLINRNIGNNGIDIAMNRIYGSVEAFVTFPPLAVTRNEHALSTVQTAR